MLCSHVKWRLLATYHKSNQSASALALEFGFSVRQKIKLDGVNNLHAVNS